MRVKQQIYVSVVASVDDTVEMVVGAVENSIEYADRIVVSLLGSSTGMANKSQEIRRAVSGWALVNDHPLPLSNHRARRLANRDLIEGTYDNKAVVYLDAVHRVSDPSIMRDAIELNSGNVIKAVRRFQWDSDNYREDGIFSPASIPVAGPYVDATWSDIHQTAPDWMWFNLGAIEGPFEIIDVSMAEPEYRWDVGEPKLRPIYGART